MLDLLDNRLSRPKTKTTKDSLETSFDPAFASWKADPSPANASALLGSVKPVLSEALRSYGGASAESPALKSRAKVLALKALETYDPTKAKVRTHLLSQLQGLRRYAARSENPIRLPEPVLLARTAMRRAETDLRDRLGRDPSDAELADSTGLSLRRIAKVRAASMPTYVEGQQRREGDEGEYEVSNPVVAPLGESAARMWQQVVYSDLSPVDQLILEHTVGLNGKEVLSGQDLARKVRLTPGAISQRKMRIQSLLDLAPAAGLPQ